MRILIGIFLFTIATLCSSIVAQTTIIKDLNASKPGQGSVVIYQDEAIEGLIGTRTSSSPIPSPTDQGSISGEIENGTNKSQPSGFIRAKGYKIQVFSGNDQKRSRQEAESRKSKIVSEFPDMEVAIIFNSPVWRARAGNFKTYEQAFQALNDLKKAFPSFGRELQIVEDVVKLPIE
ncbi:SPOR domain-containing protein [Dysgonomonas sp. 216]|uniref:SPOR domain-containing protein n=1 Tax=Dysgonomonas sp. 216 TaxID=2302934 RepID=UPI0013D43775|nr:SPOR domain-containing protein [Dysgonomonas sp. 216]